MSSIEPFEKSRFVPFYCSRCYHSWAVTEPSSNKNLTDTMGRGVGSFLVVCIFIACGADAGNREIRLACRQLRQAVRTMRDPSLPNVYNPATWLPHLNFYLDSICARATALQETWSEAGHVCTLDSSVVEEARFLLNTTAEICSEDVRQEIQTFSTRECFTDADQRYSLTTAVDLCVEDFLQLRYVALHASIVAYCSVLYNTFMGCVQNATVLACGQEVSRFISPLWKVEQNDDCYRYTESV
ncbi:hypothetical protein RRG08_016916 [Elysia crispata]|uniref:Uncharacterized protein n=1 Tax=Elysia crispata TaxID=231223 RepID=A0AAE1DI95_9GAST|nr:hypothetical protein RRG08_016916 [Elysia crispata]